MKSDQKCLFLKYEAGRTTPNGGKVINQIIKDRTELKKRAADMKRVK